MKEVIFVTGNEIKLKEANLVLKKHGIKLKKKNLNIPEPEFETIEQVATYKAKQAHKILKKPLLAEDTGVYFTAYRNFPGGYAKRIYFSIGLHGLLKLLPGKKRRAYFKAVVAYADKKGKIKLFTGKLRGKIGHKIMKPYADVLAYDHIFIPDGETRTIVEMSLSEKNLISHRACAFKKFGKWYSAK